MVDRKNENLQSIPKIYSVELDSIQLFNILVHSILLKE